MGRARRSSQGQEQRLDNTTEEIAVNLLSGIAAEAMIAQITPLLLPVLPPAILRLPGASLASDVAEEAAKITVAGAEELEVSGDGIIRAAKLDNVLYRALYGVAAARRVGNALLATTSESGIVTDESFRKALGRETRYFEAHKDVSRRRISAAKVVQGLVELHGPLLSWNWGETRTPREPRPTHLAADGSNWRPLNGAPLSTGSLPGVLRECSCAAGPPKRGARVMR